MNTPEALQSATGTEIIDTYARHIQDVEAHSLPRPGWYALADVEDHDERTITYGYAVAGPYETPEDAETAGRMVRRGERPDGAYVAEDVL